MLRLRKASLEPQITAAPSPRPGSSSFFQCGNPGLACPVVPNPHPSTLSALATHGSSENTCLWPSRINGDWGLEGSSRRCPSPQAISMNSVGTSHPKTTIFGHNQPCGTGGGGRRAKDLEVIRSVVGC